MGVGVFITEPRLHSYTGRKYGRASGSCSAVTIDLSYELVSPVV
jgi:hypothetical protein